MNVKIYKLDKKIDDDKMEELSGKIIASDMINTIIDHDADVFTTDGRLLARYRKNVFKGNHIKDFYDNVRSFANTKTSNRGELIGAAKGKRGSYKVSTKKNGVKTNILGYMDGFNGMQKIKMKRLGIKSPMTIRKSQFLVKYPDKWSKCIPFIKDIDSQYKQLIPKKHKKQYIKTKKMNYKIKGTAFTTVTINANVTTHIHKDKGDDPDGFGNLCVIEDGVYDGAETCFPQYGVGFDVRTGDVLFMDVHEWHGNLPLKLQTEDATRLSVVCYLRTGIYKQETKFNKTQKKKHNKFLEKMSNNG